MFEEAETLAESFREHNRAAMLPPPPPPPPRRIIGSASRRGEFASDAIPFYSTLRTKTRTRQGAGEMKKAENKSRANDERRSMKIDSISRASVGLEKSAHEKFDLSARLFLSARGSKNARIATARAIFTH
jgi:hypothetical protein